MTGHTDLLPSWNNTAIKRALLDFVERVCDRDSNEYVEPSARIAVFDNDGTLWSERPSYFQMLYTTDRLSAKASSDPSILTTDAMRAAADGDWHRALANGLDGVLDILAVTNAGMTVEAFQKDVADWLGAARHPETGLPYREMVFQPMLELLALLRSSDFDVWIVTGGGIHFVRTFAGETYGIPPDRVIGSAGPTAYRIVEGKPAIFKLPGVDFIDDSEGKPVGIDRQIGQLPIFAAGNSDGDFEMLEYTTSAPGARMGLLLHHTDSEREFAYDRNALIGALDRGLDEAKDRGWHVVDMSRDWASVWREP